MTFDLAREVVAWLTWLPAAILCYRAVTSWDAPWVRPDALTHYRALMVGAAAAVLSVWATAVQYEMGQADAGPVSLFNLGLLGALIAVSIAWPDDHPPTPHSWLRRPPHHG